MKSFSTFGNILLKTQKVRGGPIVPLEKGFVNKFFTVRKKPPRGFFLGEYVPRYID